MTDPTPPPAGPLAALRAARAMENRGMGNCPKHGVPYDGIALVDGYRNGKPAGWSVPVCSRCEDEKRPYRDRPFGETFRRARVAAGLTIKQAADALGVDVVFLSGVQMGRFAPPEGEEAERWMAAVEARLWETGGGDGDA